MPGMNSGLNIANPILVAAFRTALVRQGLIALLILTTLAIAWASVREWLPHLASTSTTDPVGPTSPTTDTNPANTTDPTNTTARATPTPTSLTTDTNPTNTTDPTNTTARATPTPTSLTTDTNPTNTTDPTNTTARATPTPTSADTSTNPSAITSTTDPTRAAGTSAAHVSAVRGWTRVRRQPEAAGRAVLRIGFGLLWIFDGILQAQPAMVAGLPSKVIEPAAATSPAWVQHVVNWAGTIWSYHPIQASASAVWIQVGIGVWLVAARGRWSRLAGLVSVGWGLIVWVFGEAFGGVFAPGLTVLFGAPGAVLLYCVAGALLALPERSWRSAALGRWLLSGAGLFLAAMAVLQAWPGRGFWQGSTHGQPGTLTAMIQSMAGTPQPNLLAHAVTGFGTFTARHGFAVNLFSVIALAAIGVLLLTRKPRLIRPAIALLTVFCVADWILIEDIGFLGGLGTDPNNMIPLLLLVFAGYLGMARLPATAPAAASVATADAGPDADRPAAPQPATPVPNWRDKLEPRRLAGGFASAGAQGILACWAAALVLLGAAPMALAQANPNADPIIAEAIGGTSPPINFAAPGFALTDQHGRPVSLTSLRGKVVLLTFLDPVCVTDCPLIAQEFRAADEMLGASASAVQLVAVATNPLYYTAPYLEAFDRQERLAGITNWHFLTGSLTALRQVWRNYGISALVLPAGEMVGHDDLAFVIDANGRVRTELNFDPGPGTATSQSSFAVELSQAAEQLIHTGRSSS